MIKEEYSGKTIAFKRFSNSIWNIRRLLELGVVGIDAKLEKSYGTLLEKFKDAKGVPGPRPKNYQPDISTKRLEDGGISMTLDLRTANLVKMAIEMDRRRHDDLRYFLYSNICVSVWAAFETYSQMLFEEILKKRPEMLKSKEQITVESVVSNGAGIIEYLIERQVEAIGHFKVSDLLGYYKSKINYSPSHVVVGKINDYYFIRNVIAHKSGIVRKSQLDKLPKGVKCVGDEIQISEAFLKSMIKVMVGVSTAIEKIVEKKFYENI